MDESLGTLDPLLSKIVGAPSTPDSERSLERLLMDHALPVIDSVVRRRCRSWNDFASVGDDVRGEVIVHLLRRLRTLNKNDATPINRFDSYVAGVTFRVIDDLMRRRFPRRAQLKNRLRYLLRHDRRFSWASSGEETICALTDVAVSKEPQRHSFEVETLAQHVIRLLEAQSHCELDDLVTALAEAVGITDQTSMTDDQNVASVAAPSDSPLVRSETIDSLRLLWTEIADLPSKQRVALLLSLRDEAGESPLNLLPLLGIASTAEIAAMVGVTAAEFNDVGNRLPIQDADIAGILLLTQQQVINLRKAARERLRRRFKRLHRHLPEH